jgi:hypothetical protein
MPNDKEKKEMFCRNGKPCIPKQHNAIVFDDGDKIPSNNELCSKKGFIAEETPSLPIELEKMLDILLSDKALEKEVFTITETVMQVDDQKKDLTLTEKIQIKWSPEISSLCHNAKNMYNFGNFVMRTYFRTLESDTKSSKILRKYG